jgi:hypothetical protein
MKMSREKLIEELDANLAKESQVAKVYFSSALDKDNLDVDVFVITEKNDPELERKIYGMEDKFRLKYDSSLSLKVFPKNSIVGQEALYRG